MTPTTLPFDPSNAIRIPDLDTPVYRIMSLRYFRSMLAKPELVLIRPKMWPDPFENVLLDCSVGSVSNPRKPLEFFDRVLAEIYAQSWSITQESDTLWRAYSWVENDKATNRNKWPDNAGVKIRSTPRKLLEALWRRCPASDPAETCFIGRVRYMSTAELWEHVNTEVQRHGLAAFSGGHGHAEAVLLKRAAFSYESEIRLIYVEPRSHGFSGELLPIAIDLPSVVDEVSFDPRLLPAEQKLREEEARTLGYFGVFGVSELYQRVLMTFLLP